MVCIRPGLKSCSIPIHQPCEIKNSLELPAGRNFFFLQSLCLKRYMTKRFKKISSWYSKNVTLYIFKFNFYVQFLCWFIVIWWWLISIRILSCVSTQINQYLDILTNLQADSLLCRPTLMYYVPWLRVIKKMQWQTWPQFKSYNWSYYGFFNGK